MWWYANSQLKTKRKLSKLTKSNGTLTQTEEHAQELNKCFSSVFTEEDVSQIPTLEDWYNNDPMTNIHITVDMVLKKFKT